MCEAEDVAQRGRSHVAHRCRSLRETETLFLSERRVGGFPFVRRGGNEFVVVQSVALESLQERNAPQAHALGYARSPFEALQEPAWSYYPLLVRWPRLCNASAICNEFSAAPLRS